MKAKAPAWPADRVERRPLDSLIAYATNARTHSDEQVTQLAASIREWGWTIPILVDEHGEIIAGHGRVLAARELGLDSVPVMTAKGWNDEQKRAYRIADNKLALNGDWDASLLFGEIASLGSAAFDVNLLGFSDVELARLADDADRLTLELAGAGLPDADPGNGDDHRGEGPALSGGAAPIMAPAGGNFVPFTVMLAVADRPALLEAITRAKEQGAPDTGAALVLIARAWLEAMTN